MAQSAISPELSSPSVGCCCARDSAGHATPRPIREMNPRRFIDRLLGAAGCKARRFYVDVLPEKCPMGDKEDIRQLPACVCLDLNTGHPAKGPARPLVGPGRQHRRATDLPWTQARPTGEEHEVTLFQRFQARRAEERRRRSEEHTSELQS